MNWLRVMSYVLIAVVGLLVGHMHGYVKGHDDTMQLVALTGLLDKPAEKAVEAPDKDFEFWRNLSPNLEVKDGHVILTIPAAKGHWWAYPVTPLCSDAKDQQRWDNAMRRWENEPEA